jgi:hypothetical protein
MEALRQTILPFVTAYKTNVTLGKSEAVTRLADRLREVRRRNELYFRICIGLLVAVLGASLAFVIMFREHPAAIAGVFAALGASAYGGVRQMARFWREKMATDVAIEVVDEMTVDKAMEVLEKVFLNKLT